ncbi:MAG: sn-glycerol-3-phosphate ABC transporter ATP-binding protein UgpC [Alphaproteobacteria bacterium]|nr:sn-glycerol-3-phosphate ABC transporter ATP-binding protein UgpC [Alphaproteobacteria bacterium]
MAGLTLRNVAKSYDVTKVIESIDLDIKDGEFVVFVGPSGCGKSTLLRMIAGLEDISGGTIAIGDTVVNDVAPAKRGVAMVFQTYALYPHMTVYKNMAFGLKQAKTPKDEIETRVRKAAEILEITDLLERTPRALSGGQRQRVAIGRAIVREPDVFLFDEPLSNLDAALRVQTRIEIARLHKRLGTTMIYVTHDQVEAMTLADKIVVLRGGNIEQIGSPIELYEDPQNMFVAQFIGSPKMNFFSAAELAKKGQALLKGDADRLGIRPEHMVVCPAKDALVTATPDLVENLGENALVHCKTESGVEFIVKTTDLSKFTGGKKIGLTASSDQLKFFNSSTQQRVK